MNEHYTVDDDTGKTEGPFTDNELKQKLHGAASSEPVPSAQPQRSEARDFAALTADALSDDDAGVASSEPQEWHPCTHCKQFGNSVKILDKQSYAVAEAKSWDDAVAICDAHYTALAAERDMIGLELTNKYFDQSEQRDSISELVDMEAFKRGYKQAELDLEQQLAAERELASELVGDLRIELRAEREKTDLWKRQAEFQSKHREKYRNRIKPLVEALKEVREYCSGAGEMIVDSALAKAKDKP